MFDRIFCTDERRWHALPLRAALGTICALQGFHISAASGISGQGLGAFALGIMTVSGFLTRPAAALILLAALASLTSFAGSSAEFLAAVERVAAVAGGAATLLIDGSGRFSVDSRIQARLIRCHFSTGSSWDDWP